MHTVIACACFEGYTSAGRVLDHGDLDARQPIGAAFCRITAPGNASVVSSLDAWPDCAWLTGGSALGT